VEKPDLSIITVGE